MNTLIKIIAGLSLLLLPQLANCQDVEFDQNPNAAKSLEKYRKKNDDGLATANGTTIQDTYKAFDWMQWKQEQRTLARARRYQLRMARIQRYGYRYPNYYNKGYYNNYNGYNAYNGYNTYNGYGILQPATSFLFGLGAGYLLFHK